MKHLLNPSSLTAVFLSALTAFPALAEEQTNRASNTVILTETGIQNLRLKTIEVEERDFESTVISIPSHPAFQGALLPSMPSWAIS